MLKLYNTMTKSIEELTPGGTRKESIADYPPVTIYSCGPTVYNFAHIGNFRTNVLNDLLRRYLKFRGFTVNQTMNITDVDDKTIKGAKDKGVSLSEYTEGFTQLFFDDLKKLNIEAVEHYPRATDSIDSMDEIIQNLDKQGYIYKEDGSLYFSIQKFAKYGQLSKIDSENIKSGTRYDTDEYDKHDIRDFALWKSVSEDEPGWQIEAGYGRPGWHIECSAMIRKIYGSTIDIHTGGVDLIFPHHENETAQSEAAYNETFVRHWVHFEHLQVDGSKMSKSLGNVYTLNELIEKGFSPRAIRFLLLGAHYRKKLNFTLENLKNADQPLGRIDNLVALCESKLEEGELSPLVDELCSSFITKFTETMDHDLNISGAWGHLFELISTINKQHAKKAISKGDGEKIIETLKSVDAVFGLIFFKDERASDNVDSERIEALIAERKQARADKNFARSDEIRDLLLAEGIILEDGKDGTRWKKA